MLVPQLPTQLTPYKKAKGFTLVEFIISAALSLSAILAVTSIYITNFKIDSKTIQYSRLNDEVTTIMALLSEDIKRAGYVGNSETLLTALGTPNIDDNADGVRCEPVSAGCAASEFRTIEVGKFSGESDNSCILFSYDFDDDNTFDSPDDAFGYRMNDKKLETRRAAGSCTDTNWSSLTDPDFVIISDLEFMCKVSDDGDDDDYETDTDASGNTTNIEINCTAGNLPYAGVYNGTVTVEISFTATLVDDSSVAMTTSEKILVRNITYD